MRIVVHGQQAFGRAVLERLIERGENIVAVCTAPDKEGRPLDPLKELAIEDTFELDINPIGKLVLAVGLVPTNRQEV